jgi:hypothetical protein
VLAQEDDRLGPGQDSHVDRQAELERIFADDPIAEGVERRDRGVRVAVRHELIDPDLHLLGGLIGEREGQDLGRFRPARADEPGDPSGDDLGLAGAGPGHDEERTFAVGHGSTLVGVQAHQERRDALRLCGLVVALGSIEPSPDGQLIEGCRHARNAKPLHLCHEAGLVEDHAPSLPEARDSLSVTSPWRPASAGPRGPAGPPPTPRWRGPNRLDRP